MSILCFLLLAALSAPPEHSVKGVILDGGSKQPLFGAVIAGAEGKRLAVSDKAGRFMITATQAGSLQISAPGFSVKSVAIPESKTAVDLGRVLLWRTAILRVSVSPQIPGEPLHWSLERAEPGATQVQVVRQGTVPEGKPELRIEGLEPDHYLVRISGKGPLQQIATPVTVAAGGDQAIPVTIAPSIVDLEVKSGQRPVTNAVVRFDHATFLWKGEVACDVEGKAAVELWQGGNFWLLTQSDGVFMDMQLQELAHDRAHIPVQLVLAAHSIHGHVVDASTGAPLKDVNVALEIEAKGTRSLASNADGEYRFGGVPEGHHVLRTYKKGYRFDRPVRVTVTPDDDDLEQAIRMVADTGSRVVRVVDARGTPVIGAKTYFGFGAAVQLLEETDESGVTNVPEGSGMLFVVPDTGSFGFRMISAEEQGPVTLAIPDGLGSITVISESTGHDPIPSVVFVLRVDGTLLPPPVIARLSTTQHLPFRTDADGRAQLTRLPPGRYDIWPVRTREEMEAIFRGAPPAPAATVVVALQPQNVVLTFEKATK